MEESIVRKKKKKTGTAKKVRTIIGRIFAVIGTTLGMMILCIYLIMVVCTHGPSKVARDLFVLSVRESSAGGFLANMVVSKSTIRKIEEGNKVADTNDTTDTSLIVFDKKIIRMLLRMTLIKVDIPHILKKTDCFFMKYRALHLREQW